MSERVLGVDGWKGKWVGVVLDGCRFDTANVFETLEEALARERASKIIAIDIPIGLPERGTREADVEARRFIGPRWASVFLTFPKAVYARDNFESSLEVARELTGSGISRQAYALRNAIKEGELAARDDRVIEIHPEVSFCAAAGRTLEYPKKTWNGLQERLAVLSGIGIELPRCLPSISRVPAEDVLDATIAAWSASRFLKGHAVRLSAESAAKHSGLPRGVIWY